MKSMQSTMYVRMPSRSKMGDNRANEMQSLTQLFCHDSGAAIVAELQTLMKTFCPERSKTLATNLQEDHKPW